MDYYPEITENDLIPFKLIIQAIREDPEYLTRPECPFPKSIVTFFTSLATPVNPEDAPEIQGDKWQWLENETAQLYRQLKNYGASLDGGDTAEQMSFFRTATALLEKITSINERAVGLKQIGQFQAAVLQAFEDVLEPDQRTAVISRLKGIIEQND